MNRLFVLGALLCTLTCFSQYESLDEVQIGSEFRGKGKWNTIKFNIVTDNGMIYSVSKRSGRGSRMVIDLFDKNMNHQEQFYVKGGRDDDFVAGDYIDGALKFVSFDRKDGIAKLYRVDIKNEEFIEERTIFDFSDKKLEKYSVSFFSSKGGNSNDVDTGGLFSRSATGSYYLFAMDVDSGRTGNEEHEIVVLDNQFNVHFKKNFTSDLRDKLHYISAMSINEKDGSVMLTTKAYEDGKRKDSKRKSRKIDEANYHLELVLFNETEEYNYSFGSEKFFIENVASTSKNGKFLLGGYYSDDKESGQKGIYMGLFDENLKPISSELQPFSDEFISEMHGSASERRTKRKKKKQSSRLIANEVFIDDENNAYLVGEEQFITWTTTMGMNGMGTSRTPIYHFNSIAVTKFNSEGVLLSNELVRKYQSSAGRKNDIYSYYAFLSNGRLHLFFNAESLDEKRSETSLTFKTKRESKLALYNVQMDDNGDMVYKEIIESGKNGSYAMSVRHSRKLSNNSFLTDGNDGKTKRFARISM